MAISEAFLRRSRDLWIKRERTYRAKADDAHKRHVDRSKQLAAAHAAAQPKVVMPVVTNMATNTNGWTGPNGHDGIDLICAPNAPLVAMCKAQVVRADPAGWWGKGAPSDPALKARGDGIIILRVIGSPGGPFKQGLNLCYGHAEHATVRPGQTVEAGQVIGQAGFANAWHVHMMINDRWDTKGVGDRDPRPYLDFAAKKG